MLVMNAGTSIAYSCVSGVLSCIMWHFLEMEQVDHAGNIAVFF